MIKTAIQNCGHAGQPGYVFKVGDKVEVTKATNIPGDNYFVGPVKSDQSVMIPANELLLFVK